MCGRYTLTDPQALLERFGLVEIVETRLAPRFNIAPSQEAPVVLSGSRGPILRLMRWGLRPAWMRDQPGQPRRPPPINARAETLLERPLFRPLLARRRCLVPADGFYEWQAPAGGGTRKQPMYLRPAGGGPFAFAGLFTGHPDDPREPTSFAIVTTAASESVAPIHDRMPVILTPDGERRWLSPELTDPLEALATLAEEAQADLESYPVPPLVSSVQNDGPALIEPLR